MGERRGGRGEALRRLLEIEKMKETTPGVQTGVPTDEEPRPKSGGRALMMKLLIQTSKLSQNGETSARNEQIENLVGPIQNGIAENNRPTQNGIAENNKPAQNGTSGIEPLSRLSLNCEQVGKCGNNVPVACNYIKLHIDEGKGFYQYYVTFNPENDSNELKKYFIRQMSDVIGKVRTFDGATLYLPHLLPEKEITVIKEMPTAHSNVSITIKFIKQLEMGHREAIHLYNLLFKRIQNELGFILHGDSYYNPKNPMRIPAHNLEIWPGYVTSVQDFEGGVMLCCDVSHRLLHTKTVYQWIHEVQYRAKRGNQTDWTACLKKSMISQSVLTRYNNKVYTIDDVDLESTPLSVFTKGDKEITYKDYYKIQYNLEIKDLKQPLLVSRVKIRRNGQPDVMIVKLIPELCFLSGMTDEIRENYSAMKDIATSTRLSPAQRIKSLEEFLNNINSRENIKKVLTDWGLSLAPSCIKLTARVLPMEPVITAGGRKSKLGPDWTGHVTKYPVLQAIAFTNWLCICTVKDQSLVKEFLRSFDTVSRQMGLSLGNPNVVTIQRDTPDLILKVLDQHIKNVQFVVLILPSQRTDIYNMFKQYCNVRNAMPSQVVLVKTIKNASKQRAVAQKVLLQINCKLGGTLWTIKNHVKNTMVMGMDTYHDPSRKNASCGAVVGSFDADLSHWCSSAYLQNASIELGNKLELSVLTCLEHYNSVNGCYPSQIIVYRDGVGNSQLEVVKQFELAQFLSAFKIISPNYEPKLLFIVVQKRINTRIFAYSGTTYENPLPGTVVDHTVNNKYLYDFYLASQSVRQGTATPTHYVVLFNSTCLDPDKVQKFTFMMTFLYYNYFGTIRVPAPCLYAHKLAFHVGENLGRLPNTQLNDKLFFL